MRYQPINAKLFIQNRKNYALRLKSGALSVFNSNDIMPTNADGVMAFRQNNDLFYLTGIDQEETILVLFPECKNPIHREILFIKETSEHIAIWEGHKLTKKNASEISGIKTIYWTYQFDSIFDGLTGESERIYINSNEHARAAKEVETRDKRFVKWCKEKYPLHLYERSAPHMQALRQIKSEIEVGQIQEACSITEKAFRRILKFIKPGVMEYEIEAEILHEFIRNRSRGPAYSSIIASGESACILHYIENNQVCKKGELVLMDFGAEYANYNADLTRSVPVNGRFTKRQKEVYNAVLRIQRNAIKMLKTGNNTKDYNKAVTELVTKELIDLKVLSLSEVKKQDKEKPLYKKYFMHGISHFLGLDVHDVGNRYDQFQQGMIFTCEPGLYLREEKLGIRLENDILITKNGNIDLMKNIPIEADEIESIMNS
ncbi:MAG TPA: aminopeptidase P family protein [Cytophagaceae bacterium]|jgi:Xaa-Pro aminopeptidase|nr:aminopeptidase P family protein [Cytophagaceae bacterium]